MEDRLEKILDVATSQEKAEITILHNAQVDTAKAYQAEPSASKKRDWDAAKRGYDDQLDLLWRKYFQKGQVLSSRNAAVQWLNDAGYVIGRTKVYEAANAGYIRVQTDGSVLVSDLELYAKAFLDPPSVPWAGDAEAAQEKARLEIEKLKIDVEDRKFKLDRDMGKYIPRRDFEGELAARAAVLESGYNAMVYSRAKDWLFEAGANPKKVSRVMDAMKEAGRELFDTYASTETFHVVFVHDGE